MNLNKLISTAKTYLTTNQIVFNGLYAALTIGLYNAVFFKKLSEVASTTETIAIAILLWLAIFIITSLLFTRRTTKTLAILFIILNTIALYFMQNYNISIDKIMLLNVLETDANEAADVFNPRFYRTIALYALVPIIVIINLEIKPITIKKRIISIITLIVLLLAILLPNTRNAANFLRNHKRLKYDLIPINYVGASISAYKILHKSNLTFQTIGNNATFTPYWHNDKPLLVVFVVGETARSANFSLNGYEKPTNAPLIPYQEDIYNFKNATSCGTATAVSLPCMFSLMARHEFNVTKASSTENILDLIQKNGYSVDWVDNNSGCKHVCDRVTTTTICHSDNCDDMDLVENLKSIIDTEVKNRIVVLHQQGSHGPAYYKRFNPQTAPFTPYCQDGDLAKCADENIVNAYDNSLHYTSLMLSEIIETLKSKEDKYNTLLLYISDHGESLGEKGLYLHAAPYAFAPSEQTQIPFLFWIPQSTATALAIDTTWFKEKLNTPISHDNIFHTLMGITGIKSDEYQKDYDLFAK